MPSTFTSSHPSPVAPGMSMPGSRVADPLLQPAPAPGSDSCAGATTKRSEGDDDQPK